MKVNQFLFLAGISLSVTLTACDEEDIVPISGTTPPPVTQPTTPPPNTTPPPVNTPPVTTGSLLTAMGTRTFKYDAQGRLSEVGYSDVPYHNYTIVYEGDKPVRINFSTGNWLIYTYNGDKVESAKRYYGENLVNYSYAFEYDGDKLIKQTEISYARSNEGQLGVTEYKYDEKGNLVESAIRWSTSNREEDLSAPTFIKWGGYDNNPNPVPFAYSSYYLPGIKLFVNNPGYRDPGSGKEYYNYTYHTSGMPQTRTTTLEAYPQAQPFREQFSYK